MKKIFLISMLITRLFFAFSQESQIRIAIFDPSSSNTSIDEGTAIAVREIISSTIVNTGKYSIIERSMLEKVIEEQAFSNSGIVDDNHATEIGKLAGANKVIVSVITITGGHYMFSIKMIDVKTAKIERQKVKVLLPDELLNNVELLTIDLMNIQSSSSTSITETMSIPNSSYNTIPNEGEIILCLPPSSLDSQNLNLSDDELKKIMMTYSPRSSFIVSGNQELDIPVVITFDRNIVGNSSIFDGFLIKLPNIEAGEHIIKFNNIKFKIDTQLFNYFEFQCEKAKDNRICYVTIKNRKRL